MVYLKYLFSFLPILFYAPFANGNLCPSPTVSLDVIRCAQEQHPEIKRAKLAAGLAFTQIDTADPIQNPELQTGAGFGTSASGFLTDAQIALIQPIDLGGKRSARRLGAETQHKQALTEVTQIQAKIIIETVINLHRLRQIEAERELLTETIETFGRVIAQYRGRPSLPPEQAVSLSVFRMAWEDSKLKLSELNTESLQLEQYFKLSTGYLLPDLRRVLPPSPKSWPRVQELASSIGITARSPALARAIVDQELAFSELELERAQAWPDLGLGPMVTLQKEGPVSTQLYGFQLNLALPIFNRNNAGRAKAAFGLNRADQLMEWTRTEEELERTTLHTIYQNAVAAIQNSISLEELEKEHAKSEALSGRGLISGPILIEAHRHRVELTKTLHTRELQALKSLWQIYQIDGTLFKESL